MRLFGLIGYPLSHSFSKQYFTEKFSRERINDVQYELFPLEDINEFHRLITGHSKLRGLNVTIPYKQAVIPFLDELDASADKVGAVNVIKKQDNKWVGYNSDYYGFKYSLLGLLGNERPKALVMGSGGAACAVMAALKDLNINFRILSRSKGEDRLTYSEAKEQRLLDQYHLVVNTTPLGMHPQSDTAPDLDYKSFSAGHFLFDLVYNPSHTRLMQLAASRGASVRNGLEMLHLQAEKAWEIWNS